MFSVSVKVESKPGLSDEALKLVKEGAARGVSRGADLLINFLKQASVVYPLHRRTGLLGKSWYHDAPEVDGGTIRLNVGPRDEKQSKGGKVTSAVDYAFIHEEGGKIKSTHGGKLTIPILDNLTASGVPRFPSVAALKQGMGADEVFKFKSKAGNDIIGTRGGKRKHGGLKAFFVLKDQVDIPATHYISESTEAARDSVTEQVNQGVADALAK